MMRTKKKKKKTRQSRFDFLYFSCFLFFFLFSSFFFIFFFFFISFLLPFFLTHVPLFSIAQGGIKLTIKPPKPVTEKRRVKIREPSMIYGRSSRVPPPEASQVNRKRRKVKSAGEVAEEIPSGDEIHSDEDLVDIEDGLASPPFFFFLLLFLSLSLSLFSSCLIDSPNPLAS